MQKVSNEEMISLRNCMVEKNKFNQAIQNYASRQEIEKLISHKSDFAEMKSEIQQAREVQEQLIQNVHDNIQREVLLMTEEKLNEYKHVTQEFTNLKAQ